MELIEKICRIICDDENVDPDFESTGLGHLIPEGKKYKLWEARTRVAEALINNGVINDDFS